MESYQYISNYVKMFRQNPRALVGNFTASIEKSYGREGLIEWVKYCSSIDLDIALKAISFIQKKDDIYTEIISTSKTKNISSKMIILLKQKKLDELVDFINESPDIKNDILRCVQKIIEDSAYDLMFDFFLVLSKSKFHGILYIVRNQINKCNYLEYADTIKEIIKVQIEKENYHIPLMLLEKLNIPEFKEYTGYTEDEYYELLSNLEDRGVILKARKQIFTKNNSLIDWFNTSKDTPLTDGNVVQQLITILEILKDDFNNFALTKDNLNKISDYVLEHKIILCNNRKLSSLFFDIFYDALTKEENLVTFLDKFGYANPFKYAEITNLYNYLENSFKLSEMVFEYLNLVVDNPSYTIENKVDIYMNSPLKCTVPLANYLKAIKKEEKVLIPLSKLFDKYPMFVFYNPKKTAWYNMRLKNATILDNTKILIPIETFDSSFYEERHVIRYNFIKVKLEAYDILNDNYRIKFYISREENDALVDKYCNDILEATKENNLENILDNNEKLFQLLTTNKYYIGKTTEAHVALLRSINQDNLDYILEILKQDKFNIYHNITDLRQYSYYYNDVIFNNLDLYKELATKYKESMYTALKKIIKFVDNIDTIFVIYFNSILKFIVPIEYILLKYLNNNNNQKNYYLEKPFEFCGVVRSPVVATYDPFDLLGNINVSINNQDYDKVNSYVSLKVFKISRIVSQRMNRPFVVLKGSIKNSDSKAKFPQLESFVLRQIIDEEVYKDGMNITDEQLKIINKKSIKSEVFKNYYYAYSYNNLILKYISDFEKLSSILNSLNYGNAFKFDSSFNDAYKFYKNEILNQAFLDQIKNYDNLDLVLDIYLNTMFRKFISLEDVLKQYFLTHIQDNLKIDLQKYDLVLYFKTFEDKQIVGKILIDSIAMESNSKLKVKLLEYDFISNKINYEIIEES